MSGELVPFSQPEIQVIEGEIEKEEEPALTTSDQAEPREPLTRKQAYIQYVDWLYSGLINAPGASEETKAFYTDRYATVLQIAEKLPENHSDFFLP